MIMNLSTLESIKETFNHIEIKEHQLENEIDKLLDREPSYQNAIRDIYKKMPNLDNLQEDNRQLSTKITKTSKIAFAVSSKIRKLDTAKERVAACLQRIGDILDLKFCTQNIEKALLNDDYEQAAAHIHRFLSLDENNLKKSALINENLGSFNDFIDFFFLNLIVFFLISIYFLSLVNDQNLNSLDEAFRKLHQSESNLRNLTLKKFQDAVQSNDQANVERFFKIFPLLNQHELGLRNYSNYLCRLMEDNLKVKISQETNHFDQLKILYEYTAKLIDLNQPLIETYYGPGNLIICIKIIQDECDQKAKKIISSYVTNLDLANLQITIQGLLKTTATNLVRNDPREIDLKLGGLTSINSISERYLNFLVERVLKDLESIDKSKYKDKYDELVKLYRNCKLSLILQDLNCSYVLLEEYFLKESISKAVQLDKIEENNLTSSMLDDAFFILKKCSKRAQSTKSMDALCAIINNCVSILDTVFYDTLNDRLRYGYPISPNIVNALDLSQAYNVLHSGRYLANSSDLERNRLLYLTALNNFNTACDYMRTFKTNLLEDAKKELNVLKKQELDKLEPCLVEFLSVISKFQTTINSGLSQICKAILKPKIKYWVDSFLAENHQLNENEISKYEATEGLRPFTQDFLVNIDKLIHSFKPNLTTANYEGLINVFTIELTTRLEIAIKKCSFNKVIFLVHSNIH